MKIILPKFYIGSIDYRKLNKAIEGDVVYLADTCIKGLYEPVILLHAKKPNKKKGHKEYPYLFIKKGTMYIGALTKAEFEENYRYQLAKYCEKCDEVIYSIYRHDYRHCTCGEVMVDGGRDYFRASLKGDTGTLDLLKRKFKKS